MQRRRIRNSREGVVRSRDGPKTTRAGDRVPRVTELPMQGSETAILWPLKPTAPASSGKMLAHR